MVQLFLGSATLLGLALLLPHIDVRSATFLATGGPTIALITIGLGVVPSAMADGRVTGLYDYFRSLPIPTLSHLFAQAVILSALAVPGAAASLGVAALRFDIHLRPSPLLPVAVALTVTTATALGYAVASVIKTPLLVNVAGTVLLFVALLFSPINYPSQRLPHWAVDIHHVLPFEAMATSIRSTLTSAPIPTGDLALLAGWSAATLALTLLLAARRP